MARSTAFGEIWTGAEPRSYGDTYVGAYGNAHLGDNHFSGGIHVHYNMDSHDICKCLAFTASQESSVLTAQQTTTTLRDIKVYAVAT